jgi:hypothetical protein
MIYWDKIEAHIFGMVLNFSGLRNIVTHVLGFSDKVGGIVKLHAMSKIDAVLSYSGLVWMF